MTCRRSLFALLVLVSSATGATLPAPPATPRLVVGRLHVRRDGTVAAPIILRTRRTDGIAALGFALDATGLAVTRLARGPALARAGATLDAEMASGGGSVMVTTTPRFGLPLPVLRPGRVATVYGERSPTRLRRALRVARVTFVDVKGDVVPSTAVPR